MVVEAVGTVAGAVAGTAVLLVAMAGADDFEPWLLIAEARPLTMNGVAMANTASGTPTSSARRHLGFRDVCGSDPTARA